MIVNNYNNNVNSNLNKTFANRMAEMERAKKEEAEEKLASGKRINDASDDAAGLAITEELLAALQGWGAAAQNTTSGISMTQVADGGLDEMQSMLQRVNELAVQSANGIYQDSDRSYMEAEMNALLDEIDRIAGDTEFNGVQVFQNSTEAQQMTQSINEVIESTPSSIMAYGGEDTVIALDGVSGESSIVEMIPSREGMTVSGVEGSFTYEEDVLTITSGGDFTVIGSGSETSEQIVVADDVGEVSITLSNMNVESSDDVAIDVGNNNQVALEVVRDARNQEAVISETNQGNQAVVANDTTNQGNQAVVANDTTNQENQAVVVNDTTNQENQSTIDFHVGNESDDYMSFTVQNMDSESLGLSNISIATQESALEAIDAVQSAMDMISSYRSEIGATQNQLESTYSNLMSMVENTANAASRISDADMAEEVVNAASANLVNEVAERMMAEENDVNERAVQLLEDGLITF